MLPAPLSKCSNPALPCTASHRFREEEAGLDFPLQGTKASRRSQKALSGQQRLARSELLQLIDDDPDLIFPLVYSIKNGDVHKSSEGRQKAQDEVDQTPFWNPRYDVHGRIPVYWVGGWLVQNFPAAFPSEFLLQASQDFVTQAKVFGTGVLRNAGLDKRLLEKVNTGRFYMKMVELLGSRFTKEWLMAVTNGTSDAGEIDWSRPGAGVYDFSKDEPGVLVHISGMKAS